MAEYRLTKIDPGLWKRFKVKCLQDGIDLRTAILGLIKDCLKQKKAKGA